MPLSLRINPEDVYSDVSVRAQAYADLSVKLAHSGDAYGASIAMMASDACHLQALLWQNALVASPDQDGQYAAVLAAMDDALTSWAAQGSHGDLGCASVLHGARKAIRDKFDESVWSGLAPRLSTLDHLSGMEVPDGPSMLNRRTALLSGHEPEQSVKASSAAARDAASVAKAMAESGRIEDAVLSAYTSDLEIFAAHIVARSIGFNDVEMASSEALWLLAMEAISRIGSLPADLPKATSMVRTVLREVVGMLDADNLDGQFVDVTAAPSAPLEIAAPDFV